MSLGVGLYVKNSREAVKLYQAAFGAELGYHVLNEDGGYFHSELMVDGDPVVSVCEQLPWSPWAACLVDRFGVRWFLSLPNHRPPEDFKPGDEQ